MSSIDIQYAPLLNTAYYVILLILSVIVAGGYTQRNVFFNKSIAFFLGAAIIIFLMMRPITYKFGFGDTQGYAFFFEQHRNAYEMDPNAGDIGYEFISFMLRDCDVTILFLTMACLYVVPQILACRTLTREHYGVIFFVIVTSFSYWGYGVNGMRNGAALSLVMLGMVKKNIIWTPALFLAGLSLHGSALLPIAAYCLNFFYSKSKTYVIVWGVCLVLSMFVANMLTEVINLEDFIEDDRVGYLTTEFDSETSSRFSSTGFRWDFVLYSAVPIIIGGINIFKGQVKDKIYRYLYNTYITCNAFWLFTIYIPYNNRFAYLSWFLFPVLIIYPYVSKPVITPGETAVTRRTIILNELFTFLMWLK